MPFAVSMVWREQSDHVTDCYFCMTNIRRFSRKNKSKISYLVCKSAIKPVPHDPGLSIPQPPFEKKDSLPVDKRASTTTESERILLNQIRLFKLSLNHSSSIRNV